MPKTKDRIMDFRKSSYKSSPTIIKAAGLQLKVECVVSFCIAALFGNTTEEQLLDCQQTLRVMARQTFSHLYQTC